MKWININEELPDVNKIGDGNVCRVTVKYSDGSIKDLLYGTSGAPSEGVGWFYDGDLKILAWHP